VPTRVRSGAVSQPEKPPSRFARILEVEDLLLALWLLAAEHLVVRYSGRKPVEWAEPGQNSLPWPLLLLILAALFVIFTRGSCDTSIDRAVMRRVPMFPPLFFVLPLIASIISLVRGGEKSLAEQGGERAEWPMPSAPDGLRRLVATPLFLVGDSAFLSAFESYQGFFLRRESPTFGDITLTFILVAVPYVVVVAGPRIAAGSSGGWQVWVARFAFYAFLLVTGRQLMIGGWF
jgi:hypothetical protein